MSLAQLLAATSEQKALVALVQLALNQGIAVRAQVALILALLNGRVPVRQHSLRTALEDKA